MVILKQIRRQSFLHDMAVLKDVELSFILGALILAE